MKFALPEDALAALERAGTASAAARLELAWHLRQRDSRRAARLLEGVTAELGTATTSDASLQQRAELLGCELDTLFGRVDAAEQRLADLRRRWGPHPDPVIEGDALMAEAALAKVRGQSQREITALQRAVAACNRAGDAQRLAIARASLALEQLVRPPQAPALDDPGTAAWTPTGDAASEALDLTTAAMGDWALQPARAAERLLRAAALARHMGLVRLACVATMNAGNAFRVLDDYDRAAAYLHEAAVEAKRAGWPVLIGMTQTQVGALLRVLGRTGESQKVLSAALVTMQGAPPGLARASACRELAETLLELDHAPEALAAAREGLRIYRTLGTPMNLIPCLQLTARALARVGDAGAALSDIRESTALIDERGYDAMRIGLAEAWVDLYRHCALPPPPGMTAPNAVIHFGEAALAAAAAVDGWSPPAGLLSSLAEGWAAAGDFERAYRLSRQAFDARRRSHRQNLASPIALLELLSHVGGGPPVQSAAPGPAETAGTAGTADMAVAEPVPVDAGRTITLAQGRLTRREAEILDLLARRYANKQIAIALGLSEATVKWHLKSLFGKLDVHSRQHAVMRARTMGHVGRPS